MNVFVFFGVGALGFSQEFAGFGGLMVVLHAHHRKAFISQVPQRADIAAAEHVAVHEDRPTLEAHQLGHQKSSEGEGGALFGISLAPVKLLLLKLWCDQWCDGQRRAAVRHKGIHQHIGGGPLARIHANEDGDRLVVHHNRIRFSKSTPST